MYYKIDLLNDDQLAADTVKVGDIIELVPPDGKEPRKERVESRSETDAGHHPESGEHLTRVILLLNTVKE
jgi:hypothetical protein